MIEAEVINSNSQSVKPKQRMNSQYEEEKVRDRRGEHKADDNGSPVSVSPRSNSHEPDEMHGKKKINQISFVKKQQGKFTDNYELKEQLGQGSFGKVCRCIKKISGMERAVKIIKKKNIDDPKEVQRFQDEVSILE